MSRSAKGKLDRLSASPARLGSTAGPRGHPVSTPAQKPDRWRSVAICLFLALAVWAVFGQTRHHEFINYDDNYYIYDNDLVLQGFSLKGIVWAFTYGGIGHWHPLTWLSHMLDCQLHGSDAGGHHLTNVLLHMAAVIVLFLVLRKMTGALWRSAFVAALFAVHPLRVESVAWVAERKDVLSGLFFMLTLWAYARFVRKAEMGGRHPSSIFHPPSSRDYWLALLLFALGLLSKNMLVTLPFVLLLLDYWPLGRVSGLGFRVWGSQTPNSKLQTRNLLQLVTEKIPFLLLSAMSCVATFLAPEKVLPAERVPFALRFWNVPASYLTYLWQMICPGNLAVPYLYPAGGLSVWEEVMAPALVVAITLAAIACWRKCPYLVVGWLWYLGMLVPVIGFVQISYYAHADRYTYLPQIGLYLAVAWGAVELCGGWRYRRAVLASVAVAMLAGLLMLARAQTRHWANGVSLWTHALACTSGNYIAHNNLGEALARQGKWTDAIPHYERALELHPGYEVAHNNLGVALAGQGRWDDAIPHYERALEIKPDYAAAHVNLGNALTARGRLAEAIQHLERALQLEPDSLPARYNLGNALATLGRLDQAVEHFDRAIQLNPEYAEAHNNLGVVLAGQGKVAAAIEHYERAVRIKPDYVEAHNNLGVALAHEGRLPPAVTHYEQALRLKPDYAEAHYNWGLALAGQGKVSEAIPRFQTALRLATAQNNPALADTIRDRLNACPGVAPQTRTP